MTHNPNQARLDREREERDRHVERVRRTGLATTRQEHIDAAQELLACVKGSATYVRTPLYVELAQVHATLAVAMSAPEREAA
jgi:hypothetical protein